jgi:hypothetical protein
MLGLMTVRPSAAAADDPVQLTRAALMTAGDPDSLAAAAYLSTHQTDGERLALIARAAAAAPDRRYLAWMQLQACMRVDTCDVKPVELHLRTLDPGNAAGWSGSLERAAAVKDARQVQAALAAMAASERFDLYWNPIIAHTAEAIIRTGRMDTSTAVVAAMGAGAAQAVPAWQQISHVCRGEALEEPGVRDTCRRVSAVLRRGDTYIAEMFGLSLAKRLWPADSPEYGEVVQARRVMHYRMEAESKLIPDPVDAERASHLLLLLGTHRTEQEAYVADIVAAGVKPDPSPDWTESPPAAR